MKSIHPRKLITLRSKLITSFFFLTLSLAYISAFATPPGSPYQSGATLDPTCAPMTSNCYVQIIPDQTGNNGKYLTTDGSVTSWIALTGVTQWVTTGSDIYYPTGNVGIGTSTPTQALDITGNINLTNDGTDRYIESVGTNIVNGSNIFIVAGNGQSVSGAIGGDLNLRGGNASGGFGPGSGGDVLIDGGAKSGFGEYGNVLLATLRGNVGIGDTSPLSIFTVGNGDLFQVNSSGAIAAATGITSSGTITFSGLSTTGIVHNSSAGVLSTSLIALGDLLTQGTTTDEFCLTSETGGGALLEWQSCVGGGLPLSSITAATGTNTIDNLNHAQTWNWNTLGGTALTLGTSSTSQSSIGLLKLNSTATGLDDANLFSISATGTQTVGGGTATGASISMQTNYASGSVNGLYVSVNTTSTTNTAGFFSATGAATTNKALYASASGATNNYAGIFDQGRVGIGDTTPDYILDVASTGVDGDIFSLTDSDGECLYNPEAGSVTVSCSSDERLKTNIIDASSSLEYFRSFNIREYNVIASGDQMTGVIAQEVLLIHPELVTTGVNGMYSVQLPNQWKMIKAIQEMDLNITGINDLEKENTLRDSLIAWFANASNKITRIFTGEICLTDPDGTSECINKTELHNLKQLLNTQNTGGGGGGAGGDSTPPVTTDVCPNIDGDQGSIPDGYHLDASNDCIINDAPPTEEGNPPADNPSPSENPPSN